MDTLLAQFALLIYTVYNSNRACRRQVIRKKVKDMKSSSKQPNSKMTPVLGLLAIVAVLALLAACGGNSPVSDTASNNTPAVDVPRETPSALVGTKNAGGITYTAGVNLLDPVEDKDTNNDGIPDRVANYISAVYKGNDASTTAKVEALRDASKLYNAILNLNYSQLPKTKMEAVGIKYPQAAYDNYCAFDKAFSITEFEGASREIFFANLNSALKVQRYIEIRRLADYVDTSRDCK